MQWKKGNYRKNQRIILIGIYHQTLGKYRNNAWVNNHQFKVIQSKENPLAGTVVQHKYWKTAITKAVVYEIV